MKFLALILSGFLAAGLSCSKASAQPTGNLVSPNLIGNNYSTPTGTTPYTGTGGGYSGGSTPGYNSSTNTIHFGYTSSTVAYTYAFSQALQNSGMTILGYNYSWDYLNQNPYNGTLSARVNFAGVDGTSLHLRNWTLGTTTDWTNISGTENFANSGLAASSIANFSLSFTGKDARFWAGYYGPQVRNPSLSLNYTFDQCSSNPLSSPSCPGYAAAYLTQQCTANPLYDSSCPGYAQALLTQQCTTNPLSNPQCPGYATAYLNYQCSVNPLYSSTCSGYETAYFNQQCSINPLYNTRCEGYASAYKLQQCNLDGLYARDCPNYAEAYAKKNVLNISSTTTTVPKTTTTTTVSTTEPTPTVSSSGKVTTDIAIVSDSNVNSVITSKSTSTDASSTTAPVNVVKQEAPAQQTQTTASAPQEKKAEEKRDDTSKGTGGSPSSQNTGNATASSDKPAAPTARQELQARREAAAKAEAVEKGKNLANEMGKASNMEQQVAVQNVVIQAMGFTPGFDGYAKGVVPDVAGYKPFTAYNNQKNVDNARLGRSLFGATDRLHNEMIESQYERK